MIRRRRPMREIPFSFDSFLDLVANVVGIIIRLILVVWVGARSYTGLQAPPVRTTAAEPLATAGSIEITDPLQMEMELHRRELADAQKVLLEQLRELQQTTNIQGQINRDLASLTTQKESLKTTQAQLHGNSSEQNQATRVATLSLEEMRKHCLQLTSEIQALRKLPPIRKSLYYRTPVSRPVDAEEIMFECRNGRVSFIDIGNLLREVKRELPNKRETLRDRRQMEDVAGPIGSFRLRYLIERMSGSREEILPDANLDPNAPFSIGVSGWVVEPIRELRGESTEEALKATSEFRQIVDTLNPQEMVVTFWVYPDSFPMYRQLRDYLYDLGIVVAGRVLQSSQAIAASRYGTVSRGQ